ncbi:fibronectin type III domain-containing protein [Geodermatophilus maliterrae]|uniref:Fibronectin type-III domain-containing protein n=1 Tax=Geodermatophilus maliterrae TaxID=3162531 RepID=A0ABV3XBR7_9ACTN
MARHEDDGPGGRRRRRPRPWAVRLLAGVVLGVVALTGAGSGPVAPGPDLAPASFADPVPPTGVSAVGSDRTLTVSWTASTEGFVSGYDVFLDDVLRASPTGTSAVVTGLTNGHPYQVTVRTKTSFLGSSGVGTTGSTPVTGTPRDSVAPAAPTGVVATAGDLRVVVTWTPNSADADADGYRVLRDGVPVTGLLAGRATASWTDTAVVADRTYGYTVQTHDTSGNRSASSAPVASARPFDLTPPGTPTGLTAVPGDGRVDLSWTANPEPDVAVYVVLRDEVEVARVGGTTWSDTGVVDDTTYGYRLVAVDGHGNASDPSDPEVTARPTDTTAPTTPTGLEATPGDGQVDLAWAPNPEPDVAVYVVLRDEVEVARVGGTTWSDTGVVDDTTYAYRLVAVDGHGNASDPSDPAVPATPTPDRAPAAPTGVTAVAGDGRATVRWDAVPEPDVTGYRVLAEDGGVLATVAAPVTQATVPGLVNGTEHRLRVVAVDAAGQVSAPSAEVAVVPVAARVPAEGAGQSGGVAAGADGRFVVIGTSARWEAADTNTAYELYLLDRSAGTARRIAPLPASATGSGDPTNAAAPAVSDDGRFVALATSAALVTSDTNRLPDVYRLDTRTGTWELVSVPAGGRVHASVAGTVLQGGAAVHATSPTVVASGDGDLVLFYSARPDLVPGDTNGAVDVFAKRVSTGAVTRVSTSTAGGELGRTATGPALAVTPDGRFALFPAAATNGPVVLYRKTLSGAGAGQAVVVSSVVAGGRTTEYGVYRDAGDVAISDDGRYVALVTAAKVTTPTPTAAWSTGLAYRVDTATGAVVAMGSGQTTVWEHRVELDPTGRYGFYATAAAALPADGNGHTDHYRRDVGGGGLTLVTADAGGRATTGPTGAVTAAEYGRLTAVDGDRVLVTTSQALTATDTNRLRDLYAKDLTDGTVSVPRG